MIKSLVCFKRLMKVLVFKACLLSWKSSEEIFKAYFNCGIIGYAINLCSSGLAVRKTQLVYINILNSDYNLLEIEHKIMLPRKHFFEH